MKYIDDINLFKSNKDFVAEIDMTGSLGRIYHYPQRMEGCLFLLCLRGECDITIHLSEHKIQKNDIVTILPETFVHVHRQSPDCRLYLIGFNKELLNGINLFNSTMNYLSALIDTPIIPLRPEITELFQDYFLLLIKMKRMGAKPNKDLISEITADRTAPTIIIHNHRIFPVGVKMRRQVITTINGITTRIGKTPGLAFAQLHIFQYVFT